MSELRNRARGNITAILVRLCKKARDGQVCVSDFTSEILAIPELAKALKLFEQGIKSTSQRKEWECASLPMDIVTKARRK